MEPAELKIFFNFRSPYCYLASKSMFSLFDEFHVTLVWRPLGGWTGRSAPERAKVKMPLSRQDVSRWCRKLGIPFTPPPVTTEPTRAGAGSFLAEEAGVLPAYVVETMRAEWAEGRDISQDDVLTDVAGRCGLDAGVLLAAADDAANHARLERYWEEAQTIGVFGVPTFVIGEEVFWGNDRIDFVRDHLREMRLARL